MFDKIRDYMNRPSRGTRTMVQYMGLGAKYTPDMDVVEGQSHHVLFLCDNLMLAGDKYDLIKGRSERRTRGFTTGLFNFYHLEGGGAVPIIGNRRSVHKPRRIKGEVHVVESSVLLDLDNHYKNGVQFARHRGLTAVPHRYTNEVNNGQYDESGKILPPILQGHKIQVSGEAVCHLKTWMYVGISSYWSDKLDGGYNNPQVRVVEPEHPRIWAPSYYSFPKKWPHQK